MANRLVNESSPYLLQHADNPVDWYPWGTETVEQAKRQDKPMLLSIGYSTCHWCHVMERESFENEDTAELMNQHFICVKVDREEHPDVDHVFMEAVQALTGRGGWPLTVFLTPDGEPFFGGTYFPPQNAHGLPGFTRVLETVSDAYRNRRSLVTDAARQLVSTLRQTPVAKSSPDALGSDVLDQAFRTMSNSFDQRNGGFGMTPKFPQPMTGEFLLRHHHRTHDPQALQMVHLTVDRMAAGGIYDQLGGGFHRYSTDARWLIPHFEKMLYDNALLSRLYLHAYQAAGDLRHRRIAEGILDYVLREMTTPEGGFYSAQDADTEGEEGKYYAWTVQELVSVLSREDGRLMADYFGATEDGNFEGKNVLYLPTDAQTFSANHGLTIEELQSLVERSRDELLDVRDRRTRPHRDEKILISWNAMMLASFAEAAAVLAREDYRQAAISSAQFLLEELRRGDLLMHSYKDGESKIPAYLDDYALLISALLAVHQVTFQQRWLEEAASLTEAMVQRFRDSETGLLYDTEANRGTLFVRPRDVVDSVKPCGGSAAANALLRLATITGETEFQEYAATALLSVRDHMRTYPLGFSNWLSALDFYLSGPTEIVIAGAYDDAHTQALSHVVHSRYLPNKVLLGLEPGQSPTQAVALLQDRPMVDGRSTACVCRDYACQAPTTDPATLEQQLAK